MDSESDDEWHSEENDQSDGEENNESNGEENEELGGEENEEFDGEESDELDSEENDEWNGEENDEWNGEENDEWNGEENGELEEKPNDELEGRLRLNHELEERLNDEWNDEETDESDNSFNAARPTPDPTSRMSIAPGILYDPPSTPPRPARRAHRVADHHPTAKPGTVRPMKRKLANSHSHDSTSDDSPPLMARPIPELSDLLGLGVPAYKRLIGGSLSQEQVISLIKAILTSKDEAAMIRNLRGEDAQAFVDVVNEVRSASSPFRTTV